MTRNKKSANVKRDIIAVKNGVAIREDSVLRSEICHIRCSKGFKEILESIHEWNGDSEADTMHKAVKLYALQVNPALLSSLDNLI